MNQIQQQTVTLTVSKLDALGWWQGNFEEYVSAGTALGDDFTEVIYQPSDKTKTAQFDPETQTWSERSNNMLTVFWDNRGTYFIVESPDSDFPDWAIFDQPPEYDSGQSYLEHNGEQWQILSFDQKGEKGSEPEESTYSEPTPHTVTEPSKEMKANYYLLKTDWYVTRKLETGVAIPKDVITNRDKCREILVTALPDTDFLNEEET